MRVGEMSPIHSDDELVTSETHKYSDSLNICADYLHIAFSTLETVNKKVADCFTIIGMGLPAS